jgi:hypothetical protein
MEVKLRNMLGYKGFSGNVFAVYSNCALYLQGRMGWVDWAGEKWDTPSNSKSNSCFINLFKSYIDSIPQTQ